MAKGKSVGVGKVVTRDERVKKDCKLMDERLPRKPEPKR